MYCKKNFLLFIGFAIIFSSCAPVRTIAIREYPPRKGFYHKVQAQETLWSISQIYGVSVEAIVEANRIPNAAYIEQNQLIFIPSLEPEALPILSQNIFKDELFQWPVRGRIISYFNDEEINWVNRGIRIRSNFKDLVYPARGGEIIFADFLSGYGHTVIIDHRDGYSTVYAQNDEILVSTGNFVNKETPIARIGGSGALAFLHFEVRKDARARNPLHYLP